MVGTGRTPPGRRHHDDHRSLLTRISSLPKHPAGRLDGIVVPTHRSPERMEHAIGLAEHFGCPVLTVCGGRSDVAAVVEAADARGLVCFATTDDQAQGLDLLPSAALSVHDAAPKQRNISAGRNLGVLLARLAGWRTVLFLDDDVDATVGARAGDTAYDVHEALRRIGPVAGLRVVRPPVDAVGWVQRFFPDNSVVCHANRLAGNPQASFVSTGALLVVVDELTPTFPAVYNEDWLFLFDSVLAGRVALGGYVRQLEYDPYADPARAREEEFGDLVAEGLFHLLHEERAGRLGPKDVDGCMRSPAFWAGEQVFRAAFLGDVARQLDAGRSHAPLWDPDDDHEQVVDAAVEALAAARARLAEVTPEDVVTFVDAWREDLRTWRALLRDLHPLSSVHGAFDRLGVDYRASRAAAAD